MERISFNIPGPMFRPQRDRPFQKGDFKFLILDLLQDKPYYGYEIIRRFEKRFHGFYAPSPGIVYPALKMLEEIGHVTSDEDNGKKVYSITAAGRRFLNKKGFMGDRFERLDPWDNPPNINEIQKIMREFVRLAEMLKWEVRKMEPEELVKVRHILIKAYDDIEEIYRNGEPKVSLPEHSPTSEPKKQVKDKKKKQELLYI